MSDGNTSAGYVYRWQGRKAFTLIELLVVIAIVALLTAVIMPALQKVRFQARKIACMANLHSIGLAIHAYANDHNDTIPFGPQSLSNFYTAKGNVTSLLYLYDGTPVGLGLLKDSYLTDQPKALFCPAADQRTAAKEQLVKIGDGKRVQGDYYYRHASRALMSEAASPSESANEYHIRLSRLGKNRRDRPIHALAMDVQFLAHSAMSGWGIETRTAHKGDVVNILLADSRVVTADNTLGQYTVDARTSPTGALDKILEVFEMADELR